MKKLFSILLVAMLLLTGCGNKNVDLDLNKISQELDNLYSDSFYIQGVSSLIDEKNYFEELEDVYEYDFKEVFGLTSTNIGDDYAVRINKSNNTMYLILKPLENKDKIKEEMNTYFKSIESSNDLVKSRLETEYEGYLIYIVSNDNDKVLETIKSSKSPVFNNLVPVQDEMIESTLGIKKDTYSEILMKVPMMIIQSNMYIIIKPEDGKKDDVKKAIDQYMTNLEEQWKTYLPDQYELVKNRKYEEYGGYLIYIVSSDNDKVLETIKKNEIKG